MRKLFSAIFSVMVMLSGLLASAHAADSTDPSSNIRNLHKQNFHGQRAYSKEPVPQQPSADEEWVGAGIVTDQAPEDKGFDKHQQLRLHFIGKRPYTAQ